ncbi:MAG: GC-type dockerin domain-anchored protein [Planctomycetota bacterium]
MNKLAAGLATAVVLSLACSALGLQSARVVEVRVESEAGVRVDLIRGPLEDFDSDLDTSLPFPDAEAEAEVHPDGQDPRAISIATNDGTLVSSNNFSFDVDLLIDLEGAGSLGPPPLRSASGSWATHLVFEVDRRIDLHLSARISPFDDIGFDGFEPALLTGPDGVIVSGPPEPGLSSWTWIIRLAPGRYTFETFGSYETDVSTGDGLFDRAQHSNGLSFFRPSCPADIDADGELTLFDFLAFQTAFDAGEISADFDEDGELTLFDFLAFQTAFDAGCP